MIGGGGGVTTGKHITAVVLAASLAGCVNSARQKPLAPGKPRDLEHVTSAERLRLLKGAVIWQKTDVAALDLKAGPRESTSFPFDAPVTCDYVPPDGLQTGATPKFDCAVAPDDVVKVKYGDKNGEVYSEVAATRLYWALGFGADRVYPVQITCRDCPIDPWLFAPERRVDEKTWELATIERRLKGKKIEAEGEIGWEWRELDLVDESAGGAPLAHRDALKLLTSFIQNSDTKGANQRIACLPGRSGTDPGGNETCEKAMLYVQDLGYSFGRATTFNLKRMDVGSWERTPVWRDRAQCVAQLKKSLIGTLEHPQISEAGRSFLAGLLGQLTDAQIRDLFLTARLDRRDGMAAIDDWVRVFKAKRAEIDAARCPR